MVLSFDIIELIISHLHSLFPTSQLGTFEALHAALGSISLVSHEFLLATRPYQFGTVALETSRVESFLKLVEDPRETISLGRPTRLQLYGLYQSTFKGVSGESHNGDTFNKLFMWEAKNSKSLVDIFGRITSLSINSLDLNELSDGAKLRLREISRNVRVLDLHRVVTKGFREFVASFASLSTLSLYWVHQGATTAIPEHMGALLPPTLMRVDLQGMGDPATVCSLAPCSSLKRLIVDLSFDQFAKPGMAQAIDALVDSAGGRLNSFSLELKDYVRRCGRRMGRQDPTLIPYPEVPIMFRTISFAHALNLRSITLKTGSAGYIIPFLHHLASFQFPNLEAIDIPDLPFFDVQDDRDPPSDQFEDVYRTIDQVASDANFTIQAYYTEWFYPKDIVGQPKSEGRYEKPNEDSEAVVNMNANMEAFRMKLPRLAEKGCLKLRRDWVWVSNENRFW